MLVVDLYIGAGYFVTRLCLQCHLLENILDESRQYAARFSVAIMVELADIAHNRVGLACASLPVCEDAAVISLDEAEDTSRLAWTASWPIMR